ncbi:hypothetical protein FRC98_07680 [Lujinxingia vulgaris]|uniref:Carbohydrate kinase PfkB domain-containing protein n=1 Tax=Lujinxingia vulgaris TaxID=2600176 RepID=A0A5C6XHD1_9DELT|nr:PfkB family carbohydrate kinase [Lujinxingia vulgaris]TXD37562.1 hypothetical protein FRC98_07680 [Lujinxingia vulgaris]
MRVLSAGYCTLDQIGVVESRGRGETRRELSTFSVQGGGTAATAAVALARWGVEVGMVGVVGDDERGAQIERTLTAAGVETRHMLRRKGGISQLTMVLLDAEVGRRLYVTPGNVAPLEEGEVSEGMLEGVDLLLLDGAYPAAQLALARSAKARGVSVVGELKRGGRAVAEMLLPWLDVVVTSERVASDLTGVGALQGICEGLLKRGPRVAVVTLGEEGAAGMGEDGELLREEASSIEEVDVTGAGDVFLGAVTLGVGEGWPLWRVLRFANAAAARACEGLGGRSSIGTRERIEAMIEG